MSTEGLNIGCGAFYADGWTNVDLHEGTLLEDGRVIQPDVVGSILGLPFEDASVERAYVGHILEHLAYPADVDRGLREVRRVLVPGGDLMVVGPDLDRARVPGLLRPEEDWVVPSITGRPGPNDLVGIHHLWDSTAALNLEAVRAVFPRAMELPIEDVPESWPVVSRSAWQFAIAASK